MFGRFFCAILECEAGEVPKVASMEVELVPETQLESANAEAPNIKCLRVIFFAEDFITIVSSFAFVKIILIVHIEIKYQIGVIVVN